MTEQIWERFSWYRDDFKMTSNVGGKIRIKGKALFPTLSRNNRRYIEEELIRSARTLAGKPIDVNHSYVEWARRKAKAESEGRPFKESEPKFIGHILDADYEDGAIEYVGEINDNDYVLKLKDRDLLQAGRMTMEAYKKSWNRDPIYGVSVDANYRFAKNDIQTVEPRGIIFTGLSLVEDPEKPGIPNTSIEIMPGERLMEMSPTEAQVVGLLLSDVAPQIAESYRRDVMEKLDPGSSTMHLYPRGRGDPRDALSLGDGKPQSSEACDWSLAGYSSFDDCVSKNRDKGDAQAYCSTIKRGLEEVSKIRRQAEPRRSAEESVKALEERLGREAASLRADLEALKGRLDGVERSVEERLKALGTADEKRVQETTSLKTEVAELRTLSEERYENVMTHVKPRWKTPEGIPDAKDPDASKMLRDRRMG